MWREQVSEYQDEFDTQVSPTCDMSCLGTPLDPSGGAGNICRPVRIHFHETAQTLYESTWIQSGNSSVAVGSPETASLLAFKKQSTCRKLSKQPFNKTAWRCRGTVCCSALVLHVIVIFTSFPVCFRLFNNQIISLDIVECYFNCNEGDKSGTASGFSLDLCETGFHDMQNLMACVCVLVWTTYCIWTQQWYYSILYYFYRKCNSTVGKQSKHWTCSHNLSLQNTFQLFSLCLD